jgi:hypothetical protein
MNEAFKWLGCFKPGAAEASRLGLNRSTLQFRMKKLGIERTISAGLSDLSHRQGCESISQASPIPFS